MVWLYSTKPLSALTLICHHQHPPHHFYTILITILTTYHHPTTIITNIPPQYYHHHNSHYHPSHHTLHITSWKPSHISSSPTATLTSEHHTTQTNIPSQTSMTINNTTIQATTLTTIKTTTHYTTTQPSHHYHYHLLISRLLSFSACWKSPVLTNFGQFKPVLSNFSRWRGLLYNCPAFIHSLHWSDIYSTKSKSDWQLITFQNQHNFSDKTTYSTSFGCTFYLLSLVADVFPFFSMNSCSKLSSNDSFGFCSS